MHCAVLMQGASALSASLRTFQRGRPSLPELRPPGGSSTASSAAAPTATATAANTSVAVHRPSRSHHAGRKRSAHRRHRKPGAGNSNNNSTSTSTVPVAVPTLKLKLLTAIQQREELLHALHAALVRWPVSHSSETSVDATSGGRISAHLLASDAGRDLCKVVNPSLSPPLGLSRRSDSTVCNAVSPLPHASTAAARISSCRGYHR